MEGTLAFAWAAKTVATMFDLVRPSLSHFRVSSRRAIYLTGFLRACRATITGPPYFRCEVVQHAFVQCHHLLELQALIR